MFKGSLSLIKALLVSCSIHSLGVTLVSIATVQEFVPQTHYLEVAVVSPADVKNININPDSFSPAEKANYNLPSRVPPNFFFRKRSASLEISLTQPRGGDSFSFQPEKTRGYNVSPKFIKDEQELMVKGMHVVFPGYEYWRQKVVYEREVKLRIHLSPDGRVLGVDLNRSSGDVFLDELTKDMVSGWFEAALSP